MPLPIVYILAFEMPKAAFWISAYVSKAHKIRIWYFSSFWKKNTFLLFKGLPEEVFEQLENLNYLYLANNQVRNYGHGERDCLSVFV